MLRDVFELLHAVACGSTTILMGTTAASRLACRNLVRRLPLVLTELATRHAWIQPSARGQDLVSAASKLRLVT